MRLFARGIVVLGVILGVSTIAYAQASIAGVVKDTSGAVLPGVTVEASSPALIEKARSVVTDGTGQYRIVDLRPGVYAVTFTLSGFNTFKRDAITLEGSFVATVNADLRVGALTETITVSGESPIVDVQSSQATRTLDGDLVAAIPSARGYQSFTVLQPGLNVQGADVGGSTGALFSVFQAHGGRRNEGQVQVNGLSAGWQGMGVSGYVPEVGSAQEVTFQITGGLGEAATGGPQMNLVPRTGGNAMRGYVFSSWAGEGWQGSNLSDEQKAPISAGGSGLREIGKIVKNWDLNGAIGGPIVRDKLWYLLDRPVRREPEHGRRDLPQQGRRRPEQVGLRSRQRAGGRRQHHEELEHPPHVAGLAAQQVRRLVGRAEDLSIVRRRRCGRQCRAHRRVSVARGRRQQPQPDSNGTGGLDVAGDQPAAPRRRSTAWARTRGLATSNAPRATTPT